MNLTFELETFWTTLKLKWRERWFLQWFSNNAIFVEPMCIFNYYVLRIAVKTTSPSNFSFVWSTWSISCPHVSKYLLHDSFCHVVRALLISLIIQGHGKAPWSKDCFRWRWTVQVCVCHCSTINWFLFSIIHRPNIGSLHSLHIISLTCQVLSCKKNLLISCGLVFLFFVSLS
jgi:multidrug transporter EmrE-like cation transporter